MPIRLSQIKELIAHAELNDMPDVRNEKVEQAKKRLESGFYNNPEVMGQLLDNLEDDILS